MTPHRLLIVDDERPARAKVARMLAGDGRFEVVGEAANGRQALDRIEVLRPEVVILDVQMPGLNGFELLEALGPAREFVVVFSTAHDEHALRAFDHHAVDYLLKPYDQARFRRALEKAWAQLAAPRTAAGSVDDLIGDMTGRAGRGRLVVKTVEGSWITLSSEKLIRVSAANKHVCLITADGRHLVRQTMGTIARRLDPTRFVRVHRSEIVNVGAVARLDPWAHGDGILVLADGSTVVLTRTYRQAFLLRFRGRA